MELFGVSIVLIKKLEMIFTSETKSDSNMIPQENTSPLMEAATTLKEIADKAVKLLDNWNSMQPKMATTPKMRYLKSLLDYHSINKPSKLMSKINDFLEFFVHLN
jgi:hypothetical protein